MPRHRIAKNTSPSRAVTRADEPLPYTNKQMLIPVDAKYERIPDAKLEQFLSYRTEGDSDTKAARLIGVDLRAIHYWLREDQRFADAYNDAMVHAIDCNEDRVMDLCRDGNISALKMWLEAMRPDRWAKIKTQMITETTDNRIQTLIVNRDDENQQIINDMPRMTLEDETKDYTTKDGTEDRDAKA